MLKDRLNGDVAQAFKPEAVEPEKRASHPRAPKQLMLWQLRSERLAPARAFIFLEVERDLGTNLKDGFE